ncbi:MAG: ATPase [Ruminococcus sp.]|nr:ATPase [Ruminococcus sp.]
MALSKMKLITIIGMNKYLDETVSVLGHSGVFHPDDATGFFSEIERFLPVSSKNETSPTLTKLKSIMAQAKIEPKIVDISDYNVDVNEMVNIVDGIEDELGVTFKEKENAQLEIKKCQQMIEDSSHFVGLNLQMEEIEQCEFITTDFGRLPKESYDKLSEFEDNEFVQFFPVSSDDKYYWGLYTAPLEQADEIDSIFSALYFEHVEVEGFNGTPIDFISRQKSKVEDLQNKIKELDRKAEEYLVSNSDNLLKIYTKLCELNAIYSIKSHAYTYHDNFILAGWVPAENEKAINKALESIESVETGVSDAKDEIKHRPPVKYKNNFFAKPFEYYTEMYGTPNYGEIDPSAFLAFTYSLLFGIMFGDVGHGVILFIAALVMYKVKGMELGRLLIPCSISSTIFGFVFGSVFGFEHLLDPLYHKLFGLEEKPIEVMESHWTMTIIYSAVGIGMVLVIVAMGLNIYSNFKRKNIGEAIFGVNGICGLTFYASLVIGLVCSMMLGIKIMNFAYITFLIVIPLILVFLREPLSHLIEGKKDFMPEKIGEFFVDNFFELFEVCLSYVTNTMSFLRVGAFVLVHAGMMQVVFVLASMFGSTGYIITVIIGNLIVAALEALLVGIQVLRLEYYEMFSRFYIGDGRPYKPVKVKND